MKPGGLARFFFLRDSTFLRLTLYHVLIAKAHNANH
jgi:hypothetical protein